MPKTPKNQCHAGCCERCARMPECRCPRTSDRARTVIAAAVGSASGPGGEARDVGSPWPRQPVSDGRPEGARDRAARMGAGSPTYREPPANASAAAAAEVVAPARQPALRPSGRGRIRGTPLVLRGPLGLRTDDLCRARDDDGWPHEFVTPDFFLPDHDLYIELTTMRQRLVTRKNRKFRLLRESYPNVRVRMLYLRISSASGGAMARATRSTQVASGRQSSPITKWRHGSRS